MVSCNIIYVHTAETNEPFFACCRVGVGFNVRLFPLNGMVGANRFFNKSYGRLTQRSRDRPNINFSCKQRHGESGIYSRLNFPKPSQKNKKIYYRWDQIVGVAEQSLEDDQRDIVLGPKLSQVAGNLTVEPSSNDSRTLLFSCCLGLCLSLLWKKLKKSKNLKNEAIPFRGN